jgi:uncharacterized membrane protein
LAFCQYTIQDLGFTGDPGQRMYMNQSGSVVQDNHLWINGVLSTIPASKNASGVVAGGINDSNVVVGGQEFGVNYRAFSYNGTTTDLGLFGGTQSFASGINNSGEIAGVVDLNKNNVTVGQGFIKNGSTVTNLKNVYGGLYQSAGADGITNAGVAFGASADANNDGNNVPVIWKSATPTVLPLDPGFVSGTAVAADHDGDIIVDETTAAGVTDMYLYSSTGVKSALPNMPGGSGAFAFNDNGDILATGYTANGTFESVLYEPGMGFINETSLIAGTGYTSFQGMTINDAGQIAGIAWSLNAGYHPLLLTPKAVPEPTTCAALGLGLVAYIKRRRKG